MNEVVRNTLLVAPAVSLLTWLFWPGSAWPCTDPDARAVIDMIEHAEAPQVSGFRVTLPLDNYEYLSVWIANGARGLGVARNEQAQPDSAGFSGMCQSAIYRAVKPILEAHEQQQENLL